MRKIAAATAVAVTALVFAGGAGAQAQAQTPRGYQGPAGAVQEQVRAGTGTSKTLGSLPFTGLDLALVVGAGLLLLLMGAELRRRATKRE